jgi:glyoxylase-like metal-dependent hydrolase (beta-lactamase superfamily II)
VYFRQILDERCGYFSYLIASRQTGKAAIVNPALITDQYEAILAKRNFDLRYVIDTDTHADHVSSARWLA